MYNYYAFYQFTRRFFIHHIFAPFFVSISLYCAVWRKLKQLTIVSSPFFVLVHAYIILNDNRSKGMLAGKKILRTREKSKFFSSLKLYIRDELVTCFCSLFTSRRAHHTQIVMKLSSNREIHIIVL